MMQLTVRCRAIAMVVAAWSISVAILISAAHFNVAQAQNSREETEQLR